MKISKQFFPVPLAVALAFAALWSAGAAPPALAQAPQYGALERGYRTGYSDGYQAGWGDQLKRREADYRGKPDYREADRAYVASYGQREDYRDGYRQGYEVGYAAGYERRGFDSNLPQGGVARRGGVGDDTGVGGVSGDARADDGQAGDRADRSGATDGQTRGAQSPDAGDARTESASAGDLGSVPPNTAMTVELLNRLSTDVSQRGDRFEARVVEPRQFAGTVVAGRLTEVLRPGKTSGRALLQLSFDQVRLPNGEWAEFGAQVVEVIPFDDATALEVDPEGGIRGKDSTKDDVAKVGAGAGLGAIIGGIAGGGKGAGIGAVIGAGAGTAGVMTERGKEIRFEPGQQIKIRSTGRAR